MLADEYVLGFISLSAHIPADGILSAFVVIFIISFSISSGPRLDNIKYQHSSKLWTLYVTLFNILHIYKHPRLCHPTQRYF